ncbi:MAG: hypothetical protein QOH48_1057 [Actinomycetota bacterium]|nr:hypothetical protein [Actinomycetota bacterium]
MLVRLVPVENDHQCALLIAQHHPCAAGMGSLHQQRQVEDLLVPGEAGIEIRHGKGEMVEADLRGNGHRRTICDCPEYQGVLKSIGCRPAHRRKGT